MPTCGAGYVHDLVALRAVRGGCLALQGPPTTEHSWFPFYAWTIACCATCGAHLVRARMRLGTAACFAGSCSGFMGRMW